MHCTKKDCSSSRIDVVVVGFLLPWSFISQYRYLVCNVYLFIIHYYYIHIFLLYALPYNPDATFLIFHFKYKTFLNICLM